MNTNKIDLIKAEVKKLHGNPYYMMAVKDVLAIIDSMQEEPKECMYSKDHYTDEDRKVLCDGCEEECKYAQKEEPTIPDIVDEHFDEILGEEPVSEDLKTELDKYIKDHFTIDKEQLDRFGLEEKDYMYSMDKSDMLAMVHHFVGKHQEPISEDFDALDQLLAKYAIDFSYKGKTLKECSGRYRAEIIETVNHLEPVSEDLEKAMQHNAPNNIGIDDLLYWRNGFIAGAKWQKEKEYTCYEEAFEDGAKWKVENLWKPADGDDLPEYEREVVVFTQNFPDDAGMMRVAIGHRPNPDGWDGKSLSTGKVEHYTPKTYDKGGWNIPDVKYWLGVELPKEIEL